MLLLAETWFVSASSRHAHLVFGVPALHQSRQNLSATIDPPLELVARLGPLVGVGIALQSRSAHHARAYVVGRAGQCRFLTLRHRHMNAAMNGLVGRGYIAFQQRHALIRRLRVAPLHVWPGVAVADRRNIQHVGVGLQPKPLKVSYQASSQDENACRTTYNRLT